ncbi:hypothetical protein DPMN_008960 [Dreissena polymorpha]|uniref:Uncharacterized protein n=1 Tax=Dreissena polymorpha TaxID=45954 RepID=A0A9D4N0C9_DREPO|nr:hypothetical protein DPMN_008960 [Dreissena polymorpha]
MSVKYSEQQDICGGLTAPQQQVIVTYLVLNFGYNTVSALSAKDVALFIVRNSGLLSVCSNDTNCGPELYNYALKSI